MRHGSSFALAMAALALSISAAASRPPVATLHPINTAVAKYNDFADRYWRRAECAEVKILAEIQRPGDEPLAGYWFPVAVARGHYSWGECQHEAWGSDVLKAPRL